MNPAPVRTVTPDTALAHGTFTPLTPPAHASEQLVREFQLLAPFPTGSELAACREQLRELLLKKAGARTERPTVPPGQPANAFQCVRDFEAAGTVPKKQYARLAAHLALAEALLEQPLIDVQRSGLVIVELTGYHALLKLKDPQLASLIADAWLMPFRTQAASDRSLPGNESRLLAAAIDWYAAAGESQKQAATACLWLQSAAGNPNASDAARNQLGLALARMERFGDAARILTEITDPGWKGVTTQVPDLWNRDRAQRTSDNR